MPQTENPAPLTVAASLVAVEGMVVLALGVVALAENESMEIGAPVAVFATLYAVLLLAAAWALTRRRVWGRGPSLFTQLVAIGAAWKLWTADVAFLSAVLLVSAVVALVGLVHPSTSAALIGQPYDPDVDPDAEP